MADFLCDSSEPGEHCMSRVTSERATCKNEGECTCYTIHSTGVAKPSTNTRYTYVGTDHLPAERPSQRYPRMLQRVSPNRHNSGYQQEPSTKHQEPKRRRAYARTREKMRELGGTGREDDHESQKKEEKQKQSERYKTPRRDAQSVGLCGCVDLPMPFYACMPAIPVMPLSVLYLIPADPS